MKIFDLIVWCLKEGYELYLVQKSESDLYGKEIVQC